MGKLDLVLVDEIFGNLHTEGAIFFNFEHTVRKKQIDLKLQVTNHFSYLNIDNINCERNLQECSNNQTHKEAAGIFLNHMMMSTEENRQEDRERD